MASAGKDTEGSQWFVMHGFFPHLNSRYTNFGRVTDGMETVDSIDEDDRIIRIELLE
jgi:peptidylprolyl isomerase